MRIDNTLSLPMPPDAAWALLLDIPYIAPCLPGTQLTAMIDDRRYQGTVSLRLGPIALTFEGEAEITDIDEAARRVTVRAQGRENRGRGSAHADVSFQVCERDGGTEVAVSTDLTLAGSIIQYARGVGIVTKTAQQIVDQFTARLAQQIDSGEVPDGAAIKVGQLLWSSLAGGKPAAPVGSGR